MRKQKYYLAIDAYEYSVIIDSLNSLQNKPNSTKLMMRFVKSILKQSKYNIKKELGLS